jgi:hypothetical protein
MATNAISGDKGPLETGRLATRNRGDWKLPPYVQPVRNRHGRLYFYYRRGELRVRVPGEPGTAKFSAEHARLLQKYPREGKSVHAPKPPKPYDVSDDTPLIGVYLLFLDGELVYIGSSVNMPARVRGHQTNGRPFNAAFYIETERVERLPLERALIRALHPSQNRAAKSKVDPRDTREWRDAWRKRFGSDA